MKRLKVGEEVIFRHSYSLDLNQRKVALVQSNAIAFEMKEREGVSWLYFDGKAFNHNGWLVFPLYPEGEAEIEVIKESLDKNIMACDKAMYVAYKRA